MTQGFRFFAIALFAVPFLVSCEAPNTFRNVAKDQPHAVLIAENPFGFRGFLGLGRKVSPRVINGQVTAFWRTGNRFRIAPGRTSIHAIDASEPYSYEPMWITAVAGHTYILRPETIDSHDVVTISERAPGTTRERGVAIGARAPHWTKLGTSEN
jgi:hypothetical protein